MNTVSPAAIEATRFTLSFMGGIGLLVFVLMSLVTWTVYFDAEERKKYRTIMAAWAKVRESMLWMSDKDLQLVVEGDDYQKAEEGVRGMRKALRQLRPKRCYDLRWDTGAQLKSLYSRIYGQWISL